MGRLKSVPFKGCVLGLYGAFAAPFKGSYAVMVIWVLRVECYRGVIQGSIRHG